MTLFLSSCVSAASAVTSVTCPGGRSSCPDQYTCCLLLSGDYGCCPYPEVKLVKLLSKNFRSGTESCQILVRSASQILELLRFTVCCFFSLQAVCCDDHLHCCPHGTLCNLAESTCDDPVGSTVIRCDKSTSCPGKATCCKTAGGGWACCPLPQAVCCDDHVHCCPHGTVCNLELKVVTTQKVSALISDVQDEKCDKQTMCPGGTTCCKGDSGHGRAVCCSDREHCCPKGYRCNVAEQTCDKPGALSLPWLQKIPALHTENSPAVSAPPPPVRNMCDAQTSCPKDTTCCFMDKTQKWGCCPLPNAVCCKDGNHCCPSSHTCEPHRSSCSKGPHVIPWFTKLSALTEPSAVTDVKCDDKSSCASGTTCCKLDSGEWGCCPLVKAVCCSDSKNCCPAGFSCDLKSQSCAPHSPLTWDSLFGDRKKDFNRAGL
uniref:Granulin b n=1 Tax=Labrus bergylta TaxID=56723 RepID=A0A3Q3F0H4_9LABR